MNFNYTEEQKEIFESAMKFARTEMCPQAGKYDRKGVLPMDILQKAWEIGLVNTCIPEEFGGNGFSVSDSVIITECLAYGCMGMNTAIMANDLALLPISLAGNKTQKEKYLKSFNKSFKLCSFCLTEPSYGSDAGGIKTLITEKKTVLLSTVKKCGLPMLDLPTFLFFTELLIPRKNTRESLR